MADSEDKDSKTEEATSKKLSDSREEGQVALSSEFIAAVALCVGLAGLTMAGGSLMNDVGGNTAALLRSISSMGTQTWDAPIAARILTETITSVFEPLMVVTLPAIGISLLVGYIQVGFAITPKAISVNWSKLDPIAGSKKFVSMRSWVRTGLAALKMVSITAVVLIVAYQNIPNILRVSDNDLLPLLPAVGKIITRCVVAALVVIFLLGLVDMLYQRFQHAQDMRMSKQEIKDEAKQLDGDPQLKARIRRTQQEMANRRMMDDVPNATVVITNPTHFAVALRYEQSAGKTMAPVVVAKGMDSLAQRIKAVAKEANVVTYEDVPLARALYARTEIGEEIPEDLFAAVATVLGYVYRLRSGKTKQAVGV